KSRAMIGPSRPRQLAVSLTRTHITNAGVAYESGEEMSTAVDQDARVVVVDDDPLFVEAMLVLLPQLGLAPVACVLDGAEAIAVVRAHAPDVVLVDLDMPR